MPEDRSVLSRASPLADEVVAYDCHAEQIADVRYGDERSLRRPLVVILHGGFWRPAIDRAHAGPMAAALAAAGWTVASAEYRRIPGQPDVTLHDVARALEVLPGKVARHDGRAVLIGHSAGGHLALWTAAARATPQLAGALALAPAADLRLAHERNLGDGAALAFLGTPPQDRSVVDPRQLASPRAPTTIVHGDEDAIVPLALSESYVAAHPAVRLVRLAGAGHFSVIDPLSAAWATIVRELQAIGTDSTARPPA